jgi:divalent metal cation (Fe/Co/Zn/Cd) transporter
METLGLLGAAAAFFAVGLVLVLYELSRIKAGRPILRGGIAAQAIISSIW